jgi:hypothetical protein
MTTASNRHEHLEADCNPHPDGLPHLKAYGIHTIHLTKL